MPDRSSRDTLARQWELLRQLPSHPPGATAAELTGALGGNGFVTSKRTVERDLAELERIFPIRCNDKGRPYGWHWMRHADLGIPGMGLTEALSFTLLEQFLYRMLPISLWRGFEPHLRHAREKLEALTDGNKVARWRKKVRYVSPTLPLEPPQFDDAVLEAVQRALLEERRLAVRYRAIDDSEDKALTLHPLALIQRGAVGYLAAMAFDYCDVRYYAVHRIGAAEVLPEAARRLRGFSLDAHLKAGGGHFVSAEQAQPLRLEARVMPELARILEETPLAENMRLRRNGDGDASVRATVADTWQLRWWILSQGARIEVLKPKTLRREIAEQVARLHGYYARPD